MTLVGFLTPFSCAIVAGGRPSSVKACVQTEIEGTIDLAEHHVKQTSD